MFSRVLLLTAVLSAGVRSLPVTSGQLETEDVKVMKCIVEALADVLSRPRPLPVSEDCLLTLRTDDRLVAILRHHSFLRELQDIALGGDQKRAEEETPAQQTQDTEETPDRSMLESLGGPGERSILAQESGTGLGGEGRSQGDLLGEVGGAERAHSDHEETQKRGRKDKKGSEHSEKRDSIKKKSMEELGEETRNRPKVWSKRTKAAQVKKAAAAEETQLETEKRGTAETQHHSKEDSNQEVDAERRSPEEEELQLIARNTEEREDEGSGSKKLDIESLATIESELESVAQKLHDLSRTDRGQRRA